MTKIFGCIKLFNTHYCTLHTQKYLKSFEMNYKMAVYVEKLKK